MSERRVAIVGAVGLPIGKWQTPESDDRGFGVEVLEHEILARLVVQAVTASGVDRSDINALSFAMNRPYTQQKYFATFMAAYLQLKSRGLVAEVLGNGMTGGWAFENAANEILLGRARVALALGVNFESATDARTHMMSSMRATGDVDFQSSFGISPIAWYAMDAHRYMYEFGVTSRELASIAVKNRDNAALNPLAQYRSPMTIDDVMSARRIVEPLGLLDVPPRGDGAVVLVLAEESYAREIGRPYAVVRGRGFFHEGAHQITASPNDMIAYEALQIAGEDAFADAGIARADIHFAELYAPCTIVEALAMEALRLAPRGAGARWAVEGRTGIFGDIPISTSGGLTSRGHPAYVTPLYSFLEAYEQLVGSAGARQVPHAEIGITSAELGNYNAALVHVFQRGE